MKKKTSEVTMEKNLPYILDNVLLSLVDRVLVVGW